MGELALESLLAGPVGDEGRVVVARGNDHVGSFPRSEAPPHRPAERTEPVAHLGREGLVARIPVAPGRVVQPQRAVVPAILEPPGDVDDRRVTAAAVHEPRDHKREPQRSAPRGLARSRAELGRAAAGVVGERLELGRIEAWPTAPAPPKQAA